MRLPTKHRGGILARALPPALALLLILSSVSSAQEPRPLAQRVPATDLFLYVEFDGFDAHAKEWKASAAYKALNQTTLGALLEDLAAQGLDLAMKGKMPDPPKGTQVVQTLELIARKGFALGVNGKPPQQPNFTLVVRGGISPEISGFFQRLQGADAKAARKTVQKGTRKVTIGGDAPTSDAIIDDKGDLVATTAANLDKAIAVLDGKEKNASTNPNVVELAKADGTFKPIAMAFIDPSVFGELPPPVVALGLDGLKRIDYRWGVRDTALYSVFRLVAPSPRRGITALFDGPTFDKATLPPLPSGVDGFTVASISPSQLVDKLLAIVRQVAPDGEPQINAMLGQINQMLGVKVREDLLAKLGPKWSMYTVAAAAPAPGGLPINAVALVDLADPAKFAVSLGKALEVANNQIKASGGPNAGQAPTAQFKKLAGTQLGYELVLPPGAALPPPMSALKPTILIGKKYLAIGLTAEAAKSGLAVAEGGAPRWKPDAVYASVLDNLPAGMVILSVSDPRQSLPQMIASLPTLMAAANAAIPNQGGPGGAPAIPIKIDPAKIPQPADLSSKLFPAFTAMSVDAKGISVTTRESLPSMGGNPATAGVAVALLLPAVQAAREAARRTQCSNNLKQMGLAFFNFHDAKNQFPGNIVSKQGKPLLSWRVAILPYIEQQSLYNKFKLDEPWDSPNNKPLLKEMPTVFACPSRSSPEPGMTHYQGWAGPKTLFADPRQPTSVRTIIDGTSFTIAVTEAKTAVPWTKPDDLPFDPKSNVPLLGAGSVHPGGFNVLFCDGSVRFLKSTIDPATLKALITTNGGEPIDPTKF
jgi:prepilin-type processing-associated H-X9-DG protein